MEHNNQMQAEVLANHRDYGYEFKFHITSNNISWADCGWVSRTFFFWGEGFIRFPDESSFVPFPKKNGITASKPQQKHMLSCDFFSNGSSTRGSNGVHCSTRVSTPWLFTARSPVDAWRRPSRTTSRTRIGDVL